MVSPSKFNLAGASGTWDALLHHLPNEHKSDRNVCIWSAQHTSSMQRKVQAWRTPRNPVLAKSPRTLVNNASGFDLILCAPVAEEAPIVAHSLLKDHNSTTSIAVLVPTDLLGYISTGGDPKTPEGTVERISKLVQKCAKITFASSNFTWILHNLREEVGAGPGNNGALLLLFCPGNHYYYYYGISQNHYYYYFAGKNPLLLYYYF